MPPISKTARLKWRLQVSRRRTLKAVHPDYAALRRYLVDEEFLHRRDGYYWRAGGTFAVDPFEGT